MFLPADMICTTTDTISLLLGETQGHKYSHIYNLRGKFLPPGMICTTINTISILLGEMYLHARMFCALAHTSSISMGAINFNTQEHFTLADTTSILMFAMYLHARMFCTLAPYVFYSHGCNVRAWNLFWASVAKPVLWQLVRLLPCTLPHTSSIPMGAINFYMQKHFLHWLIPLLFPCSYICYSHGCSLRAWNLFWASVAKPVLWQLMILLPCTLAHMSSIPMRAINFYMQEHFLHSPIRSHQFLPR